MFPLSWVSFLPHHVMEDYAPSDTEMIWPQRNLAIDQALNHLPLVYLEVSLSNFTKKLQGPEESKQRQETKINTTIDLTA